MPERVATALVALRVIPSGLDFGTMRFVFPERVQRASVERASHQNHHRRSAYCLRLELRGGLCGGGGGLVLILKVFFQFQRFSFETARQYKIGIRPNGRMLEGGGEAPAPISLPERANTTLIPSCGERGIRTLGTCERTTVFKTAALNHSAISPATLT